MRSVTRTLAAGLVILGLLALGSGVALAQGGGNNSAGNSQYVDPLSAHGHSKGSSNGSSSSSSSSATTSTSTSTTSSSPTLSQSAPSSVAGNGSTSSTNSGSGHTLPFTGLNLWACVALGVGLLVGGIALRRVLARVY